jgi:hypothetical protein
MRTESNASENSSVGLIICTPWRVSTVTALPGYQLNVTFIDGLQGIVDMSEFVTQNNIGVFSILCDPDIFNQVTVVYGVVTWQKGIDLAPDAMYDAIQKDGIWRL